MDLIRMGNETGIIPVVVIENADDAVSTAKALLEGGINFMEITLRTACALDAIRLVAEQVPEMIVGAGTVLCKSKALEAVASGAKFIVSPGYDEETVKYCLEKGIDVIPGVVTPTEIMTAYNAGLRILKFFPADVYGGKKALKALSGVFRDVRFLPTGGVNLTNMEEFISEPYIYAVGGSFVCTSSDISEHRFQDITSKASKAREIITGVREGRS